MYLGDGALHGEDLEAVVVVDVYVGRRCDHVVVIVPYVDELVDEPPWLCSLSLTGLAKAL